MLDTNQIYIVVDIEADSPAPGLHNMLSLAAVATTETEEVSQFYEKVMPIEGTVPDPSTMKWWKSQPEAWQEVQADAQPPEEVIASFLTWIASLGKEPIFVANPVALDYGFVSWYLFRYGHSPFMDDKNAIRSLDLRSYIAGRYDFSFNNSARANLPEALNNDMPKHSHRAIDDAIGHAIRLRKVLANKTLPAA